MPRVKLYQNEKWLRMQFLINRKTIKEIADELGCSQNSVRENLKRFGLIK